MSITEKEIHELFDQIDTDKSGEIEASELKALLKELGVDASDEDVKAFIAECDNDGNQKISKAEFTSFVMKNI